MKIQKKGFEFEIPENIMSFWFFPSYPEWEWISFNMYDYFKDDTKSFLDIGAWNGCTALYCSQVYKNVISVECDPYSINDYKRLIEVNNITNTTLIEKAAYNSNTTVTFGPRKQGWNSSMSGIQHTGELTVPTIDVKELITEDLGFIKIDIEGGEEFLFDIIKTFNPEIPVYLSIHWEWYTTKMGMATHITQIVDRYKHIYVIRYEPSIEDDIVNQYTVDEFGRFDIDKYPFFQILLSPREIDPTYLKK